MLNSLDDIEIIDKNRILGEGAFSQVLKIKHKNDNQIYALKQIDLKTVSLEDSQNLKREVKLHKELNNQNIIRYYDALQIKNMVYILLEHAENGCLFFYIDSKKGLPEALALRFFYQAALAVHYLHERNLIHRDIKPENILLDKDFNAKVCDFGWACINEKKKFRTSVCGTYEYMSPEIVKEGKHTDKVDIWCLGVMLYEMLHGCPPFSADNMDDIKEEFKHKKIMIKSSLSENTKNLLKCLLKMDFRKRFSIQQIIKLEVFKEIIEDLNYPIKKEFLDTLTSNYMENVRSDKRNIPHFIEEIYNQKQSTNNNKLKQFSHKIDDFKNGEFFDFDQINDETPPNDKIDQYFDKTENRLNLISFKDVDYFKNESPSHKKSSKTYYILNQFKNSSKLTNHKNNKTEDQFSSIHLDNANNYANTTSHFIPISFQNENQHQFRTHNELFKSNNLNKNSQTLNLKNTEYSYYEEKLKNEDNLKVLGSNIFEKAEFQQAKHNSDDLKKSSDFFQNSKSERVIKTSDLVEVNHSNFFNSKSEKNIKIHEDFSKYAQTDFFYEGVKPSINKIYSQAEFQTTHLKNNISDKLNLKNSSIEKKINKNKYVITHKTNLDSNLKTNLQNYLNPNKKDIKNNFKDEFKKDFDLRFNNDFNHIIKNDFDQIMNNEFDNIAKNDFDYGVKNDNDFDHSIKNDFAHFIKNDFQTNDIHQKNDIYTVNDFNQEIAKEKNTTFGSKIFYKNMRNRESYSSLTFVNAEFDDYSTKNKKYLGSNQEDLENNNKMENSIIRRNEKIIFNDKLNFQRDLKKSKLKTFQSNESNTLEFTLKNYQSHQNLHEKNLFNKKKYNFMLENQNYQSHQYLNMESDRKVEVYKTNYNNRRYSEYLFLRSDDNTEKTITMRDLKKSDKDQTKKLINNKPESLKTESDFKYVCKNGQLIKVYLNSEEKNEIKNILNEKEFNTKSVKTHMNLSPVLKGKGSSSLNNRKEFLKINLNLMKSSIDKKISKKTQRVESIEKSPTIGKVNNLEITKSKKKKLNNFKQKLKEKILFKKFEKDNFQKITHIMNNMTNYPAYKNSLYDKEIPSEKFIAI